MTKTGRSMTLIALALVVPPLIQVALMLSFHGSSTLVSQWMYQYGPIVVLGEVTLGSLFLFRAFRLRYALLLLIPYVPIMVLLIQGVGLFVAGVVFSDYL